MAGTKKAQRHPEETTHLKEEVERLKTEAQRLTTERDIARKTLRDAEAALMVKESQAVSFERRAKGAEACLMSALRERDHYKRMVETSLSLIHQLTGPMPTAESEPAQQVQAPD